MRFSDVHSALTRHGEWTFRVSLPFSSVVRKKNTNGLDEEGSSWNKPEHAAVVAMPAVPHTNVVTVPCLTQNAANPLVWITTMTRGGPQGSCLSGDTNFGQSLAKLFSQVLAQTKLASTNFGQTGGFGAAGGFTRQPENSKRAHFRGPGASNIHPKIPREDTQERKIE